MPIKHKRKYFLSALRVRQIKERYANLRQLHSDAFRVLRNFGGSISAGKLADLTLQSTADQIDSERQFLEAILSSSPEPRVQAIFEVHPPYDPPCSHTPAPPPVPPAETEIPVPDPAHLAGLDQLIRVVSQCAYHWTRRHGIRLPGLRHLRAALLEESRFFRETTAAAPPLLAQFRVNECGICKVAKIPTTPLRAKRSQQDSRDFMDQKQKGDHHEK
jgi:hypothetical protein